MTNSLINIAKVLSERVNNNQPTQQSDLHINVNGKKQLNYEIMFQLLMGECEKHILENNGIPREKFGEEFFKLIGDILYHIIITQADDNTSEPNDRTNSTEQSGN